MTLFLSLVAMTVGSCIEPDRFDTGGNLGDVNRITATTPIMVSATQSGEELRYPWSTDTRMDVYYSAMGEWSTFSVDNQSIGTETFEGAFSGRQAWKNNVRTHVFYGLIPCQSIAEKEGTDPSAVPMTLPATQLHESGYSTYMASSAAVSVKPGEEVNLAFEPALSLLELDLSCEKNMTLKTLTLTVSGISAGKGITGDYKIDVTDNSVNTRESDGDAVTLDFGETGLPMVTGQNYKAYAVILPSRLEGKKFTLSGSTPSSALELAVCDAADFEQGSIYKISQQLIPGPKSREYNLTATSGIMGLQTTSGRLNFQGAFRNTESSQKGISITASSVTEEYEGSGPETRDVFWEATCPEWIKLSQTEGTGKADIAVTVLPNLKPLTGTASPTVTDLSASGTANTYLIHAPGTYSLRADVMGNGDDGIPAESNFTDYNGSAISSASITGGVSAGVVWQECVDQITSVELKGSTIEFTTAETLYPGNAVIALYDGSGRIIWSWQIWCTEPLGEDIEVTNANTNTTAIANGTNKFLLMDRNLGAMTSSPSSSQSTISPRNGTITITQYADDTKAVPTGKSFSVEVYQAGVTTAGSYSQYMTHGMKYQWGRKDPFVIPYTSSSYPKFIRFDGENNEINVINLAAGGTGVTIATGISNPGIFYNASSDWIATKNDKLWGNPQGYNKGSDGSTIHGTKTIYDPCPVGYMVPDRDVWTGFNPSGKGVTNAEIIGTFGSGAAAGYYFKANSSDQTGIFFPATGYIGSTGTSGYMGAYARYWNNCPSGAGSANAAVLYFMNTDIQPTQFISRAQGNAIRCVRIR